MVRCSSPLTPLVLATFPGPTSRRLHALMEAAELCLSPGRTPRARMGASAMPGLGLLKHHHHYLCPGFTRWFDGPSRGRWDALKTPHDRVFLDFPDGRFSPNRDPAVRIVLVAEPLHAAIAHYYRVAPGNPAAREAMAREKVGSLTDFYYAFGLDMVLRQAFSFAAMARFVPGRVTILSAADLHRDPGTEVARILAFAGVPADRLLPRRDRIVAHLQAAVRGSPLPPPAPQDGIGPLERAYALGILGGFGLGLSADGVAMPADRA